MNVVYSTSDLYSELAATSIASLLVNSKDVDEINIYVIDIGISEQHRKDLLDLAAKFHRHLEFLEDLNVEEISGTKIQVGRWHISTFSRLFLLHVLPPEVHKVIYIDCDMIIRHSLKTLWEMDMEGTWCMSADDCRGKMYRKDIGIPTDSIYTNNGLMVIDLDAWRENDVETKFIEFINAHHGDITYMDQGVLNGVFQPLKKVKLLPISYNAQTICYDLGYDGLQACRKPVWAYTREEFEKGIADPTVVHFTTCFLSGTRPWFKVDHHPYRKEFLKYRKLTAWREEPLWTDTTPRAKKMMTKVSRGLPRPMTYGIIHVAHVWGYPIARNVKRRLKKH
jgi:Lipopolysaccharide biosynthesis proteins, LPS:glycosyltransferases